jgi:hypothetical protein
MRIRFVLAATLTSLLSGPAGAQLWLVRNDAPRSPADVVSADVAPVAAPPAVAPSAGAPLVGDPLVGAPPGAAPPAGVTPPVAAIRAIRPAARWTRRPQLRAPARAAKLGKLTLPAIDMTAGFVLTAPFAREAGQRIPAAMGGGPGQGSTPPPAVAAPPAPSEAAPTGAAVVPVQAEALAPQTGSKASTPPPAVPNMPRPAATQAASAPPGATPVPSYTWIEPVAGIAQPTVLLKTGPETGLAAFRAGPDILLVLDTPIDFRAPAIGLDPAFAQLTSQRTQDATVIRIPMASDTLVLARSTRGWLVTAGAPAAPVANIVPRLVRSGSVTASIRFPAAAASRVVTVLDPQTGERLLVGTQDASGQAVANAWHQAKFDLMPTLQGVVVAALSDDMRLRSEADGFTLSTGLHADGSIMQDSDRQDADAPIAGAMLRLFDIPNGSAAELAHELDERIRVASDVHFLARTEPRLRVAEAMLALGMDVEAQSVIDVAAAADPALLEAPRAIGLRAIASVLAGRFDQAATLADPRLNGSTEIELWRGFQQAAQDEASEKDAQRLAAGLSLVLGYPGTLRDRLLPTVLETMARNGQAAPAAAVLQTLPDDRSLDLARGMVLEATGQTEAALQDYDRVAHGSDRLRRYKALVRAAELRIKGGQLDARAGADVLDHALMGWRGARLELGLRARIAALRRQAGQWQEALTVLRDGSNAFPEDHAQMDRELATTFMAFIGDPSVRDLPPAAFVALYDQNADLVREISWTEQTGLGLVDRLIGLGLQGRAEPVMMRLVAQSSDPATRARLGARLSDLRMTLNDPAGAIAALADTAPPADTTLDPALSEARQLLYAHAESERGNTDTALAMLGTLGTAPADAARADIYTARKDWPQTVAALAAWEHKAISGAALTVRQQAMVMRLAVAATLAADAATVDRLAGRYGAAMAGGRWAALFGVLTSTPVQQEADLPRAFAEVQLARQLVSSLNAAEEP